MSTIKKTIQTLVVHTNTGLQAGVAFCAKALVVFWGSVFRTIGKFLHIKMVEPVKDFVYAPPLLKFWSFVIIACLVLMVLASWHASNAAWRL
jgi:hypothetical protein